MCFELELTKLFYYFRFQVTAQIFKDKSYSTCRKQCPAPCEMESLKVESGQIKIGTNFMYKHVASLRNTTEEEGKDFIR